MGNTFGLAGLTKIPGAVYDVQQTGFATYDKSYSGVLVGPLPFAQGDLAEEYPYMVLLSFKTTETGDACDHIRVDLHYEGKDPLSVISGITDDISIDFTTSQEPIESHPDFVTNIGGKPGEPKHGAIFSPLTPQGGGEFVGFPVVDPDEPATLPSRFAGVRSYLMPQETALSNSVDYTYPDPVEIESIGKVIVPTFPLPVLPGSRNWLNTGIRIHNVANHIYRTQRTVQLSGPRKWVPEIYGPYP